MSYNWQSKQIFNDLSWSQLNMNQNGIPESSQTVLKIIFHLNDLYLNPHFLLFVPTLACLEKLVL